MVDLDTFLTTLYVMADDFSKAQAPPAPKPGPAAALAVSEVITLAVFAQWQPFPSERAFYRFAQRRLRPYFPTLPHRAQFNRQVRQCQPQLVAFFHYLVEVLAARRCAYEALDTSGIPSRNLKRRGSGWLSGQADIGWCNRLGWYEGFHLLQAVTPEGVLTGFGFGAASAKDQPLAETFFAARRQPQPRLASVGAPALGCYVTDTGFEGVRRQQWWRHAYHVEVICPPKRSHSAAWPKRLRRWVAAIRQIVETVYDKLLNTFGLNRERPHALDGFQARLAAKAVLHNFCIWLNKQLGRPLLAFADLVDW